MKKLVFLVLLLSASQLVSAQYFSAADKKILLAKEDSLKVLSIKLIQGINAADRFKADSFFTRTLVRALKINHSFYHPFSSIETISILFAPDSSFRIFSWQMFINENVIRQHGAIQMRTPDGSMKLFPLIDKSDITTNIGDTIGNNLGWIGAIYYKIILKQSFNRNYYTLLGYDENNIRSSRKIIEVLTFENGEPVFGGHYFSVPDNVISPKTPFSSRYIMEFKKEAGPRLSYDPEMDMIIVEHLISESGEPNKKWTLVGDGDYEGFKWSNGKWAHINKVFNYVTPQGKEPLPKPLKDNNGNLIENKLIDPPAEKPPSETLPKPGKPKIKNGPDDY